MKITIELDSKRTLILASILIFLLVAGSTLAQRRTRETVGPESPSIAGQFLQSFTCIIGCGWPAIIILILPAVAIYIWKKVFSWG
jgi:hypothetical protein